jgi:hypothetical protein
LRKVQEGYKSRPDKFAKLHHALFPRLDTRKIKALHNRRFEILAIYNKHKTRSYRKAPGFRSPTTPTLVSGDATKIMLETLPMSWRKNMSH